MTHQGSAAESHNASILDDGLVKRAKRLVYTVHQGIVTQVDDAPESIRDLVGCALLLHYCAPHDGQTEERISAIIREMYSRAHDGTVSHSLFGGIFGYGWCIAHLQQRGSYPARQVDIAPIDSFALDCLPRLACAGHFDLISGIVGVAVYLLQRRPLYNDGDRLLRQVTEALLAMADARTGRSAWLTPRDLLQRARQRSVADDVYDLGLAHGSAGVIAMLSRLPDSFRQDVDGTIRRAADWLMTKELQGARVLRYPASVGATNPDHKGPPRLGWCYGDLSVAIALTAAGFRLNDSVLVRTATTLALHSMRCTATAGFVVDTPLCHGTQGLAHVYSRLFWATGLSVFRDAARRWATATLDILADGDRRIRYRQWREDSGDYWVSVDSILQGSAGVALSFLTMLAPEPPGWDALLLMDLPPVAALGAERNS